MFLYAGIVCTVVKPETRSGIVKIESRDTILVSPSSELTDISNPQRIFIPRTLVVFGIR